MINKITLGGNMFPVINFAMQQNYVPVIRNLIFTNITKGKKLLEDIPNKVRDILGLIVNVNRKNGFPAHKFYGALIPIQISVYPDCLYIANDCIFPADWTVDDLMGKQPINSY